VYSNWKFAAIASNHHGIQPTASKDVDRDGFRKHRGFAAQITANRIFVLCSALRARVLSAKKTLPAG
jgi:hypothetical protein